MTIRGHVDPPAALDQAPPPTLAQETPERPMNSSADEPRTEIRLATPFETARILGVKPQTLAKWRLKGTGPLFRKFGSRVMYAVPDLEAFVAAAARESTSQNAAPSIPTVEHRRK